MRIQNKGHVRNRILAGFVILALFTSMLGTKTPIAQAAAPAQTANQPKPGESGYVSLHSYVTPTDIQDVYKVTMTVSGYEVPPEETRVAVVLDNSSSMNTVIGSTTTMLDTPSNLDLSWGLAVSATGLNPGAPSNDDVSSPPRFGWNAPGTGTRLEEAVAGTKAAAEIFLTEGKNPAPDKVKVGVDAFNDYTDSVSEFPYIYDSTTGDVGGSTLFTLVPDFTYWMLGNGTSNADMMAGYGYGDSGSFDATSITYSTRYNPYYIRANNSNITVSQNEPYLNHLRGRDLISGSHADIDGMIDYASGNLSVLYKDLDDNIKASTENALTNIYAGLEEAAAMLFGSMPSSEPYFHDGTLFGGYDGEGKKPGEDGYIRRFVILLSDGEDTVNTAQWDFALVNLMKAQGVEFMTIGIDTVGGGNPTWNTDYDVIPGDKNGGILSAGPTAGDWEQFLIWMAANLEDYNVSGIVLPSYTGWTDVSALYKSPGNWDNLSDIDYTYVNPNTGGGIHDAFEAYANKIIGFGKDVFAGIDLNTEYYSLYQYPGEPLFKTEGQEGQTASRAGASITWNMPSIPLVGQNTLIFYIKIDSSKTNPDLWYPFANSAYLSYTETDLARIRNLYGGNPHVIKYFPEPIIKGSGEIKTDEPVATPTSAPNAIMSVPMGVWPIKDNSRQPYTPSVTPAPKK